MINIDFFRGFWGLPKHVNEWFFEINFSFTHNKDILIFHVKELILEIKFQQFFNLKSERIPFLICFKYTYQLYLINFPTKISVNLNFYQT
jgi:hypothetical protein